MTERQPVLFPDFVPEPPRPASTYPIAVIELGTSAIRMAIGQTDGVSGVKSLEQLVRGVSLGKDTFTRREIQRETMLQCIDVLKSYRRKLEEYQCTNPQDIRVVATSAVREATNRMAFLDRIYTATGFAVEPIDDAEIARVTYLGIRPLLETSAELRDSTIMLMEVGGGHTDVLLLEGKTILLSHAYRLGSLRLQQMLRQYNASRDQAASIMSGQIDRTLEQIRESLPKTSRIELLALGGDMRFAARLLQLDISNSRIVHMPTADLAKLTHKLLQLSVDQISRRYHLELTQAETLVPALLANLRAAQMLNAEYLLVTPFNLRDALLQGMLRTADWSEDFRDQIIHSARVLARRYGVDVAYAEHVANLSRRLFQSLQTLQSLHNLDIHSEIILYVAAMLHEVGLFVSSSAYHKHSYYVINNSELFGLSASDQRLVALVARYHRRAMPKATHQEFAQLSRDDRVLVSRLAGILRVALSLDHSRSQRIRDIECSIERKRFIIRTPAQAGDLAMERLELRQNASLFEDVFGLSVLLRLERP
ncbi:MAG: exopolyphosphatase [Planctomycetaceae bacterium]